MAPLPALNWSLLVSVTGVPKLMLVFVVVMFDPIELLPLPDSVTAPTDARAATLLEAVVNNPEFVIVVVPPTLQAAFTVRLSPVNAKFPV